MTLAVTTRPATKADAAEIALLVNIATHGLVSDEWHHMQDASSTYSPMEVGRYDVLDDNGGFNWRKATIAQSGDEVVGMLLGSRDPDVPGPIPAEVPYYLVPIFELGNLAPGAWYISMLGVHVRWRGKGIGSKLLDVAEQKRRDTAARGLSLVVEDVNTGARELYERHGFSVRESRPMVRFPSGGPDGQDWLLMVKE